MKKNYIFLFSLFIVFLGNAQETSVTLTGGTLTVSDINGGTSDDAITLNVAADVLTISGLTPPVTVSSGVDTDLSRTVVGDNGTFYPLQ